MLESKIANAPENNNFAVYFMHLKLRREFKEDYIKLEEKQSRDWIMGYLRLCAFLLLVMAYFKGVLT